MGGRGTRLMRRKAQSSLTNTSSPTLPDCWSAEGTREWLSLLVRWLLSWTWIFSSLLYCLHRQLLELLMRRRHFMLIGARRRFCSPNSLGCGSRLAVCLTLVWRQQVGVFGKVQ